MELIKIIFFSALSFFLITLSVTLHRWVITEEGHLELRRKEFEKDNKDDDNGESWKRESL